MRWIDPTAKSWELVFDEGTGKKQITIEKGRRDIYLVKYWRGDTKVAIHFRGSTPEELAINLINEGMFTEEEARSVSRRIVVKTPSERQTSVDRRYIGTAVPFSQR